MRAFLTSILAVWAGSVATADDIFDYVVGPVPEKDLIIGTENGSSHLQIYEETALKLYQETSQGPINELVVSDSYDPETGRMTIQIRDDCAWSDGTPITATDVVAGLTFAFSDHVDPNFDQRLVFTGAEKVIAGEIDVSALNISAYGDDTISFNTDVPLSIARAKLTSALFTPMPTHMEAENPGYWMSENAEKISAGPFKITRYQDHEIRLERNEHFCEGLHRPIAGARIILADSLDETLKHIPISEIDGLNLRISWRDARALESNLTSLSMREIGGSAKGVDYLFLNSRAGALTDHELRKAVWMAIDFEEFSNSEFDGAASVSLTPFNGTGHGAPGLELSTEERLTMAREILNERGYTADNPLPIRMLMRSSHSRTQASSLLIRSMLSRLPIQVELTVIDNTRDYYQGVDQPDFGGQFELHTVVWNHDYPDAASYYNYLLGDRKSIYLNQDLVEQARAVNDQSTEISDPQDRVDHFDNLADLIGDHYTIRALFQTNPRLFISDEFTTIYETDSVSAKFVKQTDTLP